MSYNINVFNSKKANKMYDINHKWFYLQNERIFYFLLSGLTYSEIVEKYYSRHKYKFIYQVRKLMRIFHLQNRRQLAYFAVKNGLVDTDLLRKYYE